MFDAVAVVAPSFVQLVRVSRVFAGAQLGLEIVVGCHTYGMAQRVVDNFEQDRNKQARRAATSPATRQATIRPNP